MHQQTPDWKLEDTRRAPAEDELEDVKDEMGYEGFGGDAFDPNPDDMNDDLTETNNAQEANTMENTMPEVKKFNLRLPDVSETLMQIDAELQKLEVYYKEQNLNLFVDINTRFMEGWSTLLPVDDEASDEEYAKGQEMIKEMWDALGIDTNMLVMLTKIYVDSINFGGYEIPGLKMIKNNTDS